MSDIKDLLGAGLKGLFGGGDDEEETLGSGQANRAAKALGGRALQLKMQECQAVGMSLDETSGRCVRKDSTEPSIDRA